MRKFFAIQSVISYGQHISVRTPHTSSAGNHMWSGYHSGRYGSRLPENQNPEIIGDQAPQNGMHLPLNPVCGWTREPWKRASSLRQKESKQRLAVPCWRPLRKDSIIGLGFK